MRTALFVASVLSVTCAFAQDSTRTRSRFEIGVYGSLNHCDRTLEAKEHGEFTDVLIDLANDLEVPKASYTLGLEVNYRFATHWFVESGLQYADLGFRTHESQFVGTDPLMNDPALIGSGRTIYSYRYLGLPLMVRYELGRKKVRFSTAIGIISDLFVKATSTSVFTRTGGNETRRTTTDTYSDYRTASISACSDLGVIYRFNARLGMRLAVTGRYQLTELVDAPITAHLWSVGLLAGLRYHF